MHDTAASPASSSGGSPRAFASGMDACCCSPPPAISPLRECRPLLGWKPALHCRCAMVVPPMFPFPLVLL